MLRHLRKGATAVAIAVLALGVAGCDDEDEIGAEDVVGTFDATTFRVIENGETIDLLEDVGGELVITLNADGTTAGRFFVPGFGEEGEDEDFDADLAGTFAFDDDDDEIRFSMEEDTFLRDVVFTADRAGSRVVLTTEDAIGGATFDVVLTRR